MKKLLLCVALCSALLLVGCNNNENVNNKDNNPTTNNNENEIVNNTDEIVPDEPIVQYESPDFSKNAGFKVDLGSSLKDVTYDAVFLMNNSTTQLDLVFPDKTIGTLIIDSVGASRLYDIDDTAYIGDIEVSIKVGADGITAYEWIKGDYTYIYSTKESLKGTEKLTNLVNDVIVIVTDDTRLK